MSTDLAGPARTVVVEVDGLHWASEKSTVETVRGRRPGVVAVQANPVAQTATVTYDPARTTVADLAGWVRDCGYHCRGESLPDHVCPHRRRPVRPPLAPPPTPRPRTAAPHTTATAYPRPIRRPLTG